MNDLKSKRFLTYEPKFLEIISDEDTYLALKEDHNRTILSLLKQNPMTVQEITEEFNQKSEDKKSLKTIYRYINQLEQLGVVVNSGQLVTEGKTATQKIYSRTAHAYYAHTVKKQWDKDEGKILLDGIIKLFHTYSKDSNVDETKLKQLITGMDSFIEEELEKIAGDRGDEFINIIEEYSLTDLNRLMEYISKLILITNADKLKKMMTE